MSEKGKDTENSSDTEINNLEELANIFEESSLTMKEKLINPGLFVRRQELSYLIANYEIFKLIQNVKGSIMYFGVYHGAGLMTFAKLSSGLEPYNHTRQIIGFDTFSGYPEITKEDTTHDKSYKTLISGGFSSDSYDCLQKIVKIYDQDRPLNHIPKISFVKGDVMETLPSYLSKNQHTLISLVVLTMNLYEPTKLAISLLWPKMPKGGVIVIHSLNEVFYPGATKAVLDVIGTNASIKTFPHTPNLAYIVKE